MKEFKEQINEQNYEKIKPAENNSRWNC